MGFCVQAPGALRLRQRGPNLSTLLRRRLGGGMVLVLIARFVGLLRHCRVSRDDSSARLKGWFAPVIAGTVLYRGCILGERVTAVHGLY